jgi:hypothetical protein
MKSGAGTQNLNPVNTMTNNTNHSTQAKVSAFAYVAPLGHGADLVGQTRS